MMKRLTAIFVIILIALTCVSCARVETVAPTFANMSALSDVNSSETNLNSLSIEPDIGSEVNSSGESSEAITSNINEGMLSEAGYANTASSNSNNTVSTYDGGNTNTSRPRETPSPSSSPPKETPSPSSKAPTAPRKEWHEAIYETINHPAEYKTVTQPAEYKTVTHPAEYKTINHPETTEKVWIVDKVASVYQEPIYEHRDRTICNNCGADISNNTEAHIKEHELKDERNGWTLEVYEVQVGTKTVTVPEEGHYKTVVKTAWTEKILVKKAWDEKKLVKEAWTDKVLVKKSWSEKKLVKEAGYY